MPSGERVCLVRRHHLFCQSPEVVHPFHEDASLIAADATKNGEGAPRGPARIVKGETNEEGERLWFH